MDLGKEFGDIIDTWNDELYTEMEEASTKFGKSSVDLIHGMSATFGDAVASRSGKSIDLTTASVERFENHLTSDLHPTEFTDHAAISTGIDGLDVNLGGGIYPGQVIEVFGASGAGKSQFLLWLAARTNASIEHNDYQEQSIFISTEGSMESRRLSDFASQDERVLDHISYIYCQDLESLDHIIFTQLKAKLDKEKECGRKIKFIIIDSIGHHLRSEDSFIHASVYLRNYILQQEAQLSTSSGFNQVKLQLDEQSNVFLKGNKSFKLRTSKKHYLLHLYRHLSTLAKSYGLAVLISNQVSDVFDNDSVNEQTPSNYDPLDFENQVGVFSGWDSVTIATESLNLEKFEQVSSGNKRRKLRALENNDEDRGFIKVSSPCNGGLSKKTPALGYTWCKVVLHRILLWKVYEPKAEDEKCELRNSHSEDGLQLATMKQVSGWRMRRFAKVISSMSLNTSDSAIVEFEIGQSCIKERVT